VKKIKSKINNVLLAVGGNLNDG